jgi:hypothetical protein
VSVTLDALIGKHLLAGVTYCDAAGQVTTLEQFHGIVIRASTNEGIVLFDKIASKERKLPPDLSAIEHAAPGLYTLSATGETVDNPDLLSTWTIHPPAAEHPACQTTSATSRPSFGE